MLERAPGSQPQVPDKFDVLTANLCTKQHEGTLDQLFIQFHKQSSKTVLREESRVGVEFVAQSCLCKAA